MWDAIFHAVRADLDDPIGAWEEHITTLQHKSDELNARNIISSASLHQGRILRSSFRRDISGPKRAVTTKGERFVANIPTEEVFTAPLKTGVNGTVRSTKPLSYGGNIIDNFSITFENGRIVDFSAEQGEDTLTRLISMDEGSHYLGEVALFLIAPRSRKAVFCITTHCLTKMPPVTWPSAARMPLTLRAARP